MDTGTLNKWRGVIRKILTDLASIPYPEPVNLKAKTVFDDEANAYLIVVDGWKGVRHLHGVVAHLEIRDGKIWIIQDGTEQGIATDLLEAGVSKDQIVLGFRTPQSRELSEFAVA